MTPSHPPFKPPRYIVNPAADRPLMWVPELYQLVMIHRNRSYLNSLWLGVGWNAMVIPARVCRELLWPLFNFQFYRVMIRCVTFPATVVAIFWHGITGRLSAVGVTLEQAMDSMILSRRDAHLARANGHNQAIIDTRTMDMGTAKGHDL